MFVCLVTVEASYAFFFFWESLDISPLKLNFNAICRFANTSMFCACTFHWNYLFH